ncbi:hypothetical protein H072_398 [Dactylellina haptotyla CBS 200.50]|uniref:Deacetylase complex subunit Sds3 n=1 Tax=Dactylellina haptotyla (strain CBS 200.50) TaxID=1284197 RepID=S8ARH9_DACHA|nr:hypothetical protein H072_398 [Dactylellina haptotyla CBS 200.50]
MASPSPIASPHPHHMQIDSPPALHHHAHAQSVQHGASSLSKRDKRRAAIANSLTELNTNFSLTKDERYRTQLSILNAEMRAIAETNCHPDTNGMLPDFGGEVEDAINDVLKNSGVMLPSTTEKAGRFYSHFIDTVNDSVERREVEMTELNFQHTRRLRNVELHHTLSLHHAEAEYQHLVGNIRQRLLTRLQQNRKKLISDKDNLDTMEPSFAYLHPAQYTNLQSERSPAGRSHLADIYSSLNDAPTRKLRGRRGEDNNSDAKSGDLLTILQTLESSGVLPSNGGLHGSQSPGGLGKRKRGNNRKNRDNRDNDDLLLNSFTEISRPSTPRSSDATTKSRSGVHASDFAKPLYTLDKLFSDKELVAAAATAQASTVKFYLELYHQQMISGAFGPQVNATNGQNGADPAGNDEDATMEDGTSNAPAGPTTRNVTSAAAASQGHNMTPVIPTSFITKSLTAPPPAPLRPEEAQSDLAEIRRLANGGVPTSYVNGLAGRSGTPLGRSLSGLAGGVAMSRGDNLSTMSSRRSGMAREDDDSGSVSGKKGNLGLGITSAGLERKASGDGSERKKQRRN